MRRLLLGGFFICASFFGALALQSQENGLSVHPSHQAANASHRATHTIQPGSGNYRLSLYSAEDFTIGTSQEFRLQIIDTKYQRVMNTILPLHERLMHLFIVDEKLEWFEHQDPSYDREYFFSRFTPPHAGNFYFFATFLEFEKEEMTIRQTKNVSPAAQNPMKLPLSVPREQVELTSPQTLSVSDFILGNVPLTFKFKSPASEKKMPTLDSYYGQIGYVNLVRKESFDYIHMHPTVSVAEYRSNPSAQSLLSFIPATAQDISPGEYRVFAEFSIRGTVEVHTFDIVLK